MGVYKSFSLCDQIFFAYFSLINSEEFLGKTLLIFLILGSQGSTKNSGEETDKFY